MKIYAPDYYREFKCIAGKCNHSCCIGWEIDIDNETNQYYKTVTGDMGKRLKTSICEDEMPHFILTENERCPFLNCNNLCDIIMELGEDRLCQICSDHPRFRNFFDGRIETGLGLCCEAAAEIIIKREKLPEIVVIEDDGKEDITSDIEDVFFNIRSKIFNIINKETFADGIDKLCDEFGISFPQKTVGEWAQVYCDLERLDEGWTKMLKALKTISNEEKFIADKWDREFKQLLVYFVYRHLSDGLYEGNINERLAFSILSVHMIRNLCVLKYREGNSITIDYIVEVSRMYSSEIEYCENNIKKLLDILGNKNSRN